MRVEELYERRQRRTFTMVEAAEILVLLKALDERLALTEDVAACLPDRRDPRKVQHALRDLVRQRVFGLACGYEDGHDAARLAHDPMHKLAVGRDPLSGAALASQPTLSRFENAMGPRALYRMGRTLAATVIAQHRHRLKGRARRITIDLDPTDDPTHGQQALAFFNGHYDTWCSLPLVATLTFNDEAEQDLVAVVLRPGNSPAKHGAFGLLRALLRRLRRAFPGTPLRVRVDRGIRRERLVGLLGSGAGRVCRGAGLQPAAGAARRSPAGRGLRPVEVQRPHRACLRRDARCGPKLVASSARDHQSRSSSAPWAGSQMQSAVCRDQSPRGPGHGLCDLLSARGHGASAKELHDGLEWPL